MWALAQATLPEGIQSCQDAMPGDQRRMIPTAAHGNSNRWSGAARFLSCYSVNSKLIATGSEQKCVKRSKPRPVLYHGPAYLRTFML